MSENMLNSTFRNINAIEQIHFSVDDNKTKITKIETLKLQIE